MSGSRSLPRVFVPGASAEAPIELPAHEVDKLRKVLRLSAGAEIAVLPNDGTLIRCEFQNRMAMPRSVEHPQTEPTRQVRIAQALPKGDKIDEIVRACTEMGVSEFVFFASDRTVVRWDDKKREDRLQRLRLIAQEASEVCYRTRLPRLSFVEGLAALLAAYPDSLVLSESERESKPLPTGRSDVMVVIGPEGGWSPREMELIGPRGVTLGPRVLRVDHAGPAAAAILLLSYE